jgi:hypothetical protein
LKTCATRGIEPPSVYISPGVMTRPLCAVSKANVSFNLRPGT